MKISGIKQEKISEQILAFLYASSPKSVFTSHIAKEIARDEEFTKRILLSLKRKRLVIEISKNFKGQDYKLRRRWKISDNAYRAYSAHQI